MNVNTMIIAEAGVNHNGSLLLAKRLIDEAANAGADAVKFQTFKSEKVVTKIGKKANYQIDGTSGTDSQLEMIRELELSDKSFHKLADHANNAGIEFLSTPFDEESAYFLNNKIGVRLNKIPSGEITNGPFLLMMARFDRPIILSTGMSTLGENEHALGIIAFGLEAKPGIAPSSHAFGKAFDAAMKYGWLKDKVTLLHCTTEYPAPFNDVHLQAMKLMSQEFGLPIGYSDHTSGISIPLAAVALGAVVLEKHFTLDRTLEGPDHRASLEPSELCEMVSSIRAIEKGLGLPKKICTTSEQKNLSIARRRLVSARPINKGELFTEEAVTAKRPAGNISPMKYWDLIGTPAKRDYVIDEPLDL